MGRGGIVVIRVTNHRHPSRSIHVHAVGDLVAPNCRRGVQIETGDPAGPVTAVQNAGLAEPDYGEVVAVIAIRGLPPVSAGQQTARCVDLKALDVDSFGVALTAGAETVRGRGRVQAAVGQVAPDVRAVGNKDGAIVGHCRSVYRAIDTRPNDSPISEPAVELSVRQVACHEHLVDPARSVADDDDLTVGLPDRHMTQIVSEGTAKAGLDVAVAVKGIVRSAIVQKTLHGEIGALAAAGVVSAQVDQTLAAERDSSAGIWINDAGGDAGHAKPGVKLPGNREPVLTIAPTDDDAISWIDAHAVEVVVVIPVNCVVPEQDLAGRAERPIESLPIIS